MPVWEGDRPVFAARQSGQTPSLVPRVLVARLLTRAGLSVSCEIGPAIMIGHKTILLVIAAATAVWGVFFAIVVVVTTTENSSYSPDPARIRAAELAFWHATIGYVPIVVFLIGSLLILWSNARGTGTLGRPGAGWWIHEPDNGQSPLQFSLKWLFLIMLTVAVLCCMLRCDATGWSPAQHGL